MRSASSNNPPSGPVLTLPSASPHCANTPTKANTLAKNTSSRRRCWPDGWRSAKALAAGSRVSNVVSMPTAMVAAMTA
jgi:hypothetical protein